jgi:hypothetical protein
MKVFLRKGKQIEKDTISLFLEIYKGTTNNFGLFVQTNSHMTFSSNNFIFS